MADKYMKKCSTSQITKAIQVKTTTQYTTTPLEWLKLQSLTRPNTDEAVEQPGWAHDDHAS